MPGGNRESSGGSSSFLPVGSGGFWWSATKDGYSPYYRDMGYNEGHVYENTIYDSMGFSVRCVED